MDSKANIISPNNFNDYTYSKKKHFRMFYELGFDEELFHKTIDPGDCDLKVYQDLLTFGFIKHNLPEGSKLLDIGGGDSRILKYFGNDYECWNIDKLEGVGNGPTDVDMTKYRLVQDYIGNFSTELPENYFDLVFSISTLEHVDSDDEENHADITEDIQRVLTGGGFSLHCIDVVWKNDFVWTNNIIKHFFENTDTINEFVPPLNMIENPDLFTMSEKYFSRTWQHTTGKSYADFGRPISYNVLWRKADTGHTDSEQK